MSGKTVDERIVQMSFDNRDFEKNVQTSLSTLDKLRSGLNLSNASRGLENIQNAAKNFSMTGMVGALDSVIKKFSTMDIIGITAIQNITNSTINAGKQMLRSLTVDPVKQGFDEYELKMGSVQTIMASTGESLESVMGYLNELNTYSDKTIYSFSDMTTNIGKFTNAGVGLKDAVKAIQGISNVAAVSGANTNEASRAMYNFAQALSAGHVKLIDWKSIENANMATVEFKTQLLETAVEMGTLQKSADGMYTTLKGTTLSATQNFNDTLQEQWMTTDVLISTLGAYSDETTEIGKKAFAAAQDIKTFSQLMDTLKESVGSGWATTWEVIFGDFEEAKKLWTSVGEVVGNFINEQSDARNELLKGWKALGGRQALLVSLRNAFNGLVSVVKPVKKAFKNIFPPVTARQLFDLTLNLKHFSARLKLSEEASLNLKRTAKGLFSVFKIVGQVIGTVVKAVAPMTGGLTTLAGKVLEITSLIGRWITVSGKLNVVPMVIGHIVNAIKGFASAFGKQIGFSGFDTLKEKIAGIYEIVKEKLSFPGMKAFRKSVESLDERLSGFAISASEAGSVAGEAFSKVANTVKNLFLIFKNCIETVKNFWGSLGEELELPGLDSVKQSLLDIFGIFKEKVSLGGMFSSFKDLSLPIGNLDSMSDRMESVKEAASELGSSVGKSIKKVGESLSDIGIVQILSGIWTGITKVGTGLSTALGKIAGALFDAFSSPDFNNFLENVNSLSFTAIGVSIARFVNSLGSLSKKSGGFMDGLSDTLEQVRGTLEAYQTKLKSEVLLKIAAAIAILVGSVLVLTMIDSEKLSKALGALTVMFTELVGSMAILTKTKGDIKGVASATFGMIGMASAVLVLSFALAKIGSMDMADLGKGLLGVFALIAMLTGTAKILGKKSKSFVKLSVGLVIFAKAVGMMADVCKEMGEMDIEQLGKGLLGVGALLASVSLFLNNTKMSGKAIGTALGILILSAALKVLVSVAASFGNMSWEQIGKGLAGIGAVLLEVSAFTKLTGNSKKVISTGAALVLIAASMKIFASAVGDFAQFSWEQIGKGMTAMGGALLSVGLATRLMPKNMVGTGIGLLAIAGSMEILTDVFGKMGNMSWDQIGKSLAVMGGALAELCIGLNLMKGTTKGSFALLVASASLALLAPVMKTLGSLSWGQIARGLTAIAGSFAVIGVAGLVLKPLVPTIVALAGAFALVGVSTALIGVGLLAASVGISTLAAVSATGATAITASLAIIITGIASLIPLVAQKIGEGIVAFCQAINEGVPVIGETIKTLVLTLVDVLVTCVPQIVDGALTLISSVLSSLASHSAEITESLMLFLIGVLEGITAQLPTLITAAVDLVMAFFSGVADALSGIDTDTLLKGIVGVGLMSGIMLALSAVAGLTAGAMAGVLGMGAVIAELALVLAAIGGLAQIPGLSWLIDEGGSLLEGIGTAIGKFVGGIVGGALEGVTSSFGQIGTDLSTFMTNAQPFIEGAKGVDAAAMEGVKSLAEVVLILTAADILQGLTSWLTGGSSIVSFGKELAEFGPHFATYAASVSGIDANAVQASATAAESLASFATTIPNSGGALASLVGDNSLAGFGKELAEFGPHFASYAASVAGLDGGAVTASATAAQSLASLASSLPNEGGVLETWFGGTMDLDTFGKQLLIFGPALKSYSLMVSGLDAAAVTASSNAALSLANLASNLPAEDGALQKWFGGGSMDLATFGNNIIAFGENFAKYARKMSKVKPEVVDDTANAAASLVNLQESLPEKGGWFSNDTDLPDFGESLKKFGEKFKLFYDAISGVDIAQLNGVISGCRAISGILRSIETLDFGNVDPFCEAMQTLGELGVAEFTKAFEGAPTELLNISESMMDSVLEGISNKEPALEGAVSNVFSSVTSSVTSSMNGLVTNLRNYYTSFYDIGKYLVDGFRNGISDSIHKAQEKAREMAASAKSAAKQELDEHSPSRVFYAIGAFAGQGFVNALSDYSRKAYNASSGMAESARKGLTKAAAGISASIDENVNTDPVIRPVLDLSDVRTGAGRLNGLLDMNRSISLTGSLAANTSTLMNNRPQNGNEDVISAIGRLEKSIGSGNGNVYNVNGITYDDGSNISSAVKSLIRAARVERRM